MARTRECRERAFREAWDETGHVVRPTPAAARD